MATRRPILVTGSHRSGTTWVGQMLATSPAIAYINEPFSPTTYRRYRGRCAAHFPYWNTYVTQENEADFYPYLKNTLEFRYNLSGQIAANKNLSDFRRTIKEYFLFASYRLLDKTPLLKDPLAIFSAEWLFQRFNLQVLVLIRHPAAFAISLKRLNWRYNFAELLQQPLLLRDHLAPFAAQIAEYAAVENDIIDRAALIWKIVYHVVHKYQQQYDHWLYRRYEDLACNPVLEFETLFRAFSLDFSPAVQTVIQTYTDATNPVEAPEKDWAMRKRNSAANIQSWKQKLTEAEIDRLRSQVEAVSQYFYTDADW